MMAFLINTKMIRLAKKEHDVTAVEIRAKVTKNVKLEINTNHYEEQFLS